MIVHVASFLESIGGCIVVSCNTQRTLSVQGWGATNVRNQYFHQCSLKTMLHVQS